MAQTGWHWATSDVNRSKSSTLFDWPAKLEVHLSVEIYKGPCFLVFPKRESKPSIVRPKLASHPKNPPSMASSSNMNRYWIPHLDIHKKVITQELQYYLGPEATVRPFTREVRHPPLSSGILADEDCLREKTGI